MGQILFYWNRTSKALAEDALKRAQDAESAAKAKGKAGTNGKAAAENGKAGVKETKKDL